MNVLSVKCPHCKQNFENTENIYTTECGHIHHSACLNEVITRGNCRECGFHPLTLYKLFLSFDESIEDLDKIKELKEELKTSNEVITELLVEVSEAESNFLKLHKQFSVIEKSKQELEERIKQLKDSESNFMRLQGQYTETSELSLKLGDRINELLIENELKAEEMKLKKLENQSLKEEKKINTLDSKCSDRINILQHKFKHISEKFQREIETSSQLSRDILKLKSNLEQLKSMDETKVAESNQNNSKSRPKRNHRAHNNENARRKNEKPINKVDNVTSKSVLIKNLPIDLITSPLVNIIIKLASKMKLSVSSDDFVKVSLLSTEEQDFSKAEVLAEFKIRELGDKFLSNKDILKNDPETKSIIICNFENNSKPSKGLNIIENYSAGNNRKQLQVVYNEVQEDKAEINNADEYFYNV